MRTYWQIFWMDTFFGEDDPSSEDHLEWIAELIHPCLTTAPGWYSQAGNDNGE